MKALPALTSIWIFPLLDRSDRCLVESCRRLAACARDIAVGVRMPPSAPAVNLARRCVPHRAIEARPHRRPQDGRSSIGAGAGIRSVPSCSIIERSRRC
jgi:hypothetical protein